MASVPASHLILFIASLIVAAGIAGTVVLEVNQLSDAVEMRSSNVAEEIATDIEITSDTGYDRSIYDGTEDRLTILVKNIGSEHLSAHRSQIDLLIDGKYVHSDIIEVERVDVDDDSWRVGGVIKVTVNVGEQSDLDVSGDTRVTAIVNGNEDTIAFHANDGSDTS